MRSGAAVGLPSRHARPEATSWLSRNLRFATHCCLAAACVIALLFWASSSYRLSRQLTVHADRSRAENPHHHQALDAAAALADKLAGAQSDCEQHGARPAVRPLKFPFAAAPQYKLWSLPADGDDQSVRCAASGICDGSSRCGPDELGCVLCAAGRRSIIQQAARESWAAYTAKAWGSDELVYVLSATGRPQTWMGLGLTIVDSLDTLLMLGLKEEYQDARKWVVDHLLMDEAALPSGTVSVFEVTIRILGGLLSAYHLGDGDEVYLKKAIDLAERLLPAFNTTNGIVRQWVHLRRPTSSSSSSYLAAEVDAAERREPHNLAKAGSLSLEFTTLALWAGRKEFREVSMAWWDHQIDLLGSTDGLICTHFDADSAKCSGHLFSLGPSADSCYEYMLKQWLISNKSDVGPLKRYKAAMRGMRKHLVVAVHPVPPEATLSRWRNAHHSADEALLDEAEADDFDEDAALRAEVEEELKEHVRGQEEATTANKHDAADFDSKSAAAIRAANAAAAALGEVRRALRQHRQKQEQQQQEVDGVVGTAAAVGRARSGSSAAKVGSAASSDLLWLLVDAELPKKRVHRAGHDRQLAARHLNSSAAAAKVSTKARSGGGDISSGATKKQQQGAAASGAHTSKARRAMQLHLQTHHLACFAPGLLALGHMHGVNTARDVHDVDDLLLAVRLMRACYELALQSPTGLAYEMVSWAPVAVPLSTRDSSRKVGKGGKETSRTVEAAARDDGGIVFGSSARRRHLEAYTLEQESGSSSGGGAAVTAAAAGSSSSKVLHAEDGGLGGAASSTGALHELSPMDRANYLRPEIVESLFYLYRATGDQVYREWGWSLFRAFHRYSRQPDGGHSSVSDVTILGRPPPVGRQESFWIAEVLKYFYLLFSDEDDYPLDRFVFNTEAHPIPIHGLVFETTE